MDYKPRYPQPYTLAQATALDVSVISEGLVVILKGNATGSHFFQRSQGYKIPSSISGKPKRHLKRHWPLSLQTLK